MEESPGAKWASSPGGERVPPLRRFIPAAVFLSSRPPLDAVEDAGALDFPWTCGDVRR